LISIRPAVTEDAPQIASLSRRTFFDSFAKFNSKENMDKFMAEQFSIEFLEAEVKDGSNIFLLAYLDDELVGYAKMTDKHKPEGLEDVAIIELCRIYTEQWTIGQGIGKSLMLECFEIAKAKGKKIIWLGVWQHNEIAIAFYKKFGFEKFGTHIFMLGDDPQTDWLLKRNL
jgi:diamine N-acetyltransferase